MLDMATKVLGGRSILIPRLKDQVMGAADDQIGTIRGGPVLMA